MPGPATRSVYGAEPYPQAIALVWPMAGRVAVIGAGSWGTTVASLVSSNTPTVLWARRPELAESLRTDHATRSISPARPA